MLSKTTTHTPPSGRIRYSLKWTKKEDTDDDQDKNDGKSSPHSPRPVPKLRLSSLANAILLQF